MTDIIEKTKITRSTILRELRTTVGYLRYVLSLKHGKDIRERKANFLSGHNGNSERILLEKQPFLKDYGKILHDGEDEGYLQMRKPINEI